VRKSVDIVIATSGRLKDHVDRGSVDLSRVALLRARAADNFLAVLFDFNLRGSLSSGGALNQATPSIRGQLGRSPGICVRRESERLQ